MSYTIRLVNCGFYAFHGVLEAEAALGQRFFVDAVFTVDAPTALTDDAFEATLDYGAAYAVIAAVVTGRRFRLIEALAHAIGKEIMERFPVVQGATVTVRKPAVPIAGLLDHAEVSVTLP